MRFTEAMLSIPSLFLADRIGQIPWQRHTHDSYPGAKLQRHVGIVIIVIGLTSWMYWPESCDPTCFRCVKWIHLGAGHWRQQYPHFLHHLVPNSSHHRRSATLAWPVRS